MAKLNAAQLRAVTYGDGPLLVLAGAGTGKTRVITHRIADLVERRSVLPDSIFAVTFTNKAAHEMAERMAPLIGVDRTKKLWLSTFHSFGLRFLSEESKEVFQGASKFVVYDQSDVQGIMREVVKREGLADRKLDMPAVAARISLWKNQLRLPEDIKNVKGEYDEIALAVYPHYQRALRSMRAVDFDDLVFLPVKHLRENESLSEKWGGRFRYILIDEFQDTNAAQLELIKELSKRYRNICAVGDDDQSIYGWRGAEVSNILDFDGVFPGANVVALEENYRSDRAILDVANFVARSAQRKRHDKNLVSGRNSGDKVRLCVLGNQEQEARFVAEEVRRFRTEGRTYRDAAVLYRSNLQAAAIEEEFRSEGIPYRLLGGTELFDRKEVKDAIAYLRTVVHPQDELAFRRVLNYPSRGIGDATIERVERWGLVHRVSFVKAWNRLDEMDDIPDIAERGARKLNGEIEKARLAISAGEPLAEVAKTFLVGVGLQAELLAESASDKAAKPGEEPTVSPGQRRWNNVEFVIRMIEKWSTRAENPLSLTQILQRMALDMSSTDDGRDNNTVTLSTLHSAKGLEWPVVFLIGINEGTLPHRRIMESKVTEAVPADLEEERRLFYVGVTRARDRLYLTRPLRKSIRGKEMGLAPSRFLTNLPEDSIELYERDDQKPLEDEQAESFSASFLAMLKGQVGGPGA